MHYISWGHKESDMTEQLSMQEVDLFRIREKHTLQTECGPSQATSAAAKCVMVSFYRLGMLISGKIIPSILGKGWRVP